MSMSTNVVGFKPVNKKWEEMKAIFVACEAAGIEPPDEVWKFFNDRIPDMAGVQVELEDTPCCEVYNQEMENGFEISIDKLPKDVKILRFWNSF